MRYHRAYKSHLRTNPLSPFDSSITPISNNSASQVTWWRRCRVSQLHLVFFRTNRKSLTLNITRLLLAFPHPIKILPLMNKNYSHLRNSPDSLTISKRPGIVRWKRGRQVRSVLWTDSEAREQKEISSVRTFLNLTLSRVDLTNWQEMIPWLSLFIRICFDWWNTLDFSSTAHRSEFYHYSSVLSYSVCVQYKTAS